MKKLTKKERKKIYLKTAMGISIGESPNKYLLKPIGVGLNAPINIQRHEINKAFPELEYMNSVQDTLAGMEWTDVANVRIIALCLSAAMCD